jgi:hypothetical protein
MSLGEDLSCPRGPLRSKFERDFNSLSDGELALDEGLDVETMKKARGLIWIKEASGSQRD